MDDGKTTGIGAFAFLLGGMLGAAIGITSTRHAGLETRQRISGEVQTTMNKSMDSFREAQDKALSAIEETQSRIERLSQETRDRLGKLQEIVEQTGAEQKQSLKKGVSRTKKVVKK